MIGGKWHLAHRLAWKLAGRPIPDGCELDHLCRRRNCINTDHLEAVTPTENKRRGAATKLTLEEVHEIRDLRAGRWLAADIAEAYGVSRVTVYRIGTGRTWADAA